MNKTETAQMPRVLTIAGSDCSGGAGIQADLKTMTAHKAYGMSIITALTAQNTCGVAAIHAVPPEFVTAQLKAVFEDIPPQAAKIGMTANAELIAAIAAGLRAYHASNIVLDPVMAAESGARLIEPDAVQAIIDLLLPLADIITPNKAEAEILSGLTIHDRDDMRAAARKLSELTPAAVLIKGGHMTGDACDLLLYHGEEFWFCAPRVNNPNSHGTGCTLSSAIACRLAEGKTMPEACRLAKEYLTDALQAGLDLGRGKGPLNHCCRL